LENNDEEEIEASTQMGEEELVNLKDKENMYKFCTTLDLDRCEIFHSCIGRFVIHLKPSRL
jgi:hypothetical protein